MKLFLNHRPKVLPYTVLVVLILSIAQGLRAQPGNNTCAAGLTATYTLNSASGLCNALTGTLKAASGGSPNATGTTSLSTFCTATATSPDVWYNFVATTPNPTITLRNMGTNMRITPVLQIFNTSSCTVATQNANNNGCITASNPASLSLSPSSALTPGNTYLVRVATTTTINGGHSSASWQFDICVSDPPANDLCAAAVAITSSPSCVNTSGSLFGATYTTVTGACGTSGKDVWYSFTAKSTNPTITLSSTTFANPRLQLYSGSCGSPAAGTCGNSSIAATGLTIGNPYWVRVYSNTNEAGTFDICITDPAPSNDLCAGSILITSTTGCSTTSGNIYASLTAPGISGVDCAGTVTADVWYRFVAQTTNPTISLSSLGSQFTNPGIQLLTNSCGSPTSLFCGTSTLNANFLTPGTTYLIRVYTTGALPNGATNAGFSICITDPVLTPSNNECTGAVNLAVNANCNNAPGNMAGATPSGVALGGTCTSPNVYDVWYRFAAVSTNATITLSNLGPNFTNSGIEILSGTCGGSFTSVACATGLSVSSSSLTAGNTYYVRVYSRSAPIPAGNARFSICVTTSGLPAVRFGNSYVNISKKTTGGVVQPGDTLEIRMTINHTSGTMYRLRYVDNIPTRTSMIAAGTGRFMGVITNEGLVYRNYSLTGGDDGGTYVASPTSGQYNIRMNLAFGSSTTGSPPDNTNNNITSTSGTMIANTDRPRGGGGMLFATAFRVVVTGAVGDTINLNAGQFIYRTSSGGTDVILTSTPYKILITSPLNLCTNSIGINNAAESGGTFGSGTALTRTTDLISPIAGYNFVNDMNEYNAVGDGNYSIVKNMSPHSSTTVNARRESQCNVPAALHFDDPLNCNNRMYGHWDIGGDHTGTVSSTGNTPPAAATNSGYMLMVNADFVASEIYRQTLNNLCPNTYYEFSAWIKNICPTCGVDSVGDQFDGTPTAPTLGYPGVYPNLAFALNGVDYYSTGEVDITGWQKRGFVFRTGATQTSAVFTIRNNAQGGGGNDWVMDDIAVATCLPTMSYSPTINPTICQNNPITINDTISSYFRNYTTYKWQRSTNSGSTWTDITGVTTLPDTNYYITSYNIPLSNTTLANNNDRYRVVVATTADNLVDPNCNISDGVTISLTVMNCGMVLKTDLLSFSGRLLNGYGILSWSTAKEDDEVHFELERSNDGISFSKIATVDGKNNGQSANYYSFTDPQMITSKKWYRVIVLDSKGSKKYSSVIQLSAGTGDFEIDNVVNPFSDQLLFNLHTEKSSKVTVELINMQGRIVKSNSYLVYAGVNSLRLPDTGILSAGIYTLRIQKDDKTINKKVMKQNN